jgi:hypothetical protein
MEHVFPSGEVIEIRGSGFPNGPNQVSGQMSGTSYWWRLKGTKSLWEPNPCRGSGNMWRWLEMCESFEDWQYVLAELKKEMPR